MRRAFIYKSFLWGIYSYAIMFKFVIIFLNADMRANFISKTINGVNFLHHYKHFLLSFCFAGFHHRGDTIVASTVGDQILKLRINCNDKGEIMLAIKCTKIMRLYVTPSCPPPSKINALFIRSVCLCVSVNVCVNFNIVLMVTQTHTQRMGLKPSSASTIHSIQNLTQTLMQTHTQMVRVNKA